MHSYTPINEKGMRNYNSHLYRTKNGKHLFELKYIPQRYNNQEYFEIVILDQPDYGTLAQGSGVTHRLSSSIAGKKKVCIFDDKLIQASGTLDKARAFSMLWAEMTSEYILTRVTIDKQIKNIHGRS